nr:hypothetical protein BaRGS_021989 [Batillaria attramentaria]
MTSSTQPVVGDRGNPYYAQELHVGIQDTMSATSQGVTGDRGNPYYTQELNVLSQDTMLASSQPVTGDRGNPYYSQELNIGAEDTMVSGSEEQYEEYDDDDDDDDDEDDTTEEEEEETVEFEKRVTLFTFEDGKWKKLGLGNLRVIYDDDLNGKKLDIVKDDGDKICNHVICMEHAIVRDKKSCEWQPKDFSTDEPVRRHFKATFSSEPAAEEFATIFREGQKLAAESEISEKLPEEIDVPEIFSAGDGKGAAAKP